MPIPAVVPPPSPILGGYEPGTVLSDLTMVLDDSQGTGTVITFGVADENRVAWRVTNLDGWDSPDLPEDAQDRPGSDGLWDATNYYGGRQITVEGLVEAPDTAALQAAKKLLMAAVPARGRMVTFTVNEPDPTQVTCRRSGRLMFDYLTDMLGQFSMTLLAPDPRRYSINDLTATGSLGAPGSGAALPLVLPAVFPEREGAGEFFDVENDGDYDTPVLVRIVGPGRNLGIANLTTGQTLTYLFDLADGDELLIDTDAGAATLNGSAYRAPAAGSTVTGQFLLPPGVSSMQFLGSRTVAGVSPLLSMTWRSASI